MSQPPNNEIAKVIGGRFRIDRLLGRGGMGEVYAAKNLATGREVALKMISGAAVGSTEHKRRFLREAKAATAIRHPNVIEVLDVFEDDQETPVMVMELLHGETLAEYRKRAGALRLYQLARVLGPVVRAVRAAHALGIVHRDLKPDNIFLVDPPGPPPADPADLDRPRIPKVLDFGIAKVLDPTSISSDTQGDGTSTGSILGTPHYMSFEQAMSEKSIDHRADIWAIGVIAFEAMVGRRPIEFENLGQMYKAFLQGTLPRVGDVLPDLPEDVGAVLDRCLQKQPATRLDDLLPLAEVLDRYVDPETPGARAGGVVVEDLDARVAATQVTRSAMTVRKEAPDEASSALSSGWVRAALVALALVAAVGAFAIVSRSGRSVPTPAGSGTTAAPFGEDLTAATARASAAQPPSAVQPSASASAPTAQPPSTAPAAVAIPITNKPVVRPTPSADPHDAPKPIPGGVIEKPPF